MTVHVDIAFLPVTIDFLEALHRTPEVGEAKTETHGGPVGELLLSEDVHTSVVRTTPAGVVSKQGTTVELMVEVNREAKLPIAPEVVAGVLGLCEGAGGHQQKRHHNASLD